VPRRWFADDHICIVAAPGPSLTPEVAECCAGFDVIAVQDAYRLMPWAPILYGCDVKWWKWHRGAWDFAGEKWSTDGPGYHNDKWPLVDLYGLRLATGKTGNAFSTDPEYVVNGTNSGFQAIGLAILFGARRVVLVGFDMRERDGKTHFFGDHPAPLKGRRGYDAFISNFNAAAKKLPPGVSIVNATPGSALKCFPMVDLQEALGHAVAA
jgi:hypothetical protein